MSARKNVAKAKAKVTQVLTTARESLKLLEALEKDTVARAKAYVRMPVPMSIASLRKLGLASAGEVESLRLRVERLEAQITVMESKIAERA